MIKCDEKSGLALKEVNAAFSRIIIVIPSLNPDDKLISAVKGLRAVGFKEIILVNDGVPLITVGRSAWQKVRFHTVQF